MEKLTVKKITEIEEQIAAGADMAGLYRADHGLYLSVGRGGARSWIFRYQHAGRRRDMGLGSYPEISLPKARAAALEARQRLAAGNDPLTEKKAPAGLLFDQAAEQFISAHEAGWRNAKHRAQWRSTISTYASPIIGKKPVSAVDVADIKRILDPLWTTKTETATRVRQRVESILDWSKVQGLRDGDNPARWRGHLEYLLPAPALVREVEHQPALPYEQVPAFMAALRETNCVSAASLAFGILTVARPGNAAGARWPEIDLRKKLWTVPADRMKRNREHRVALTRPALAILRAMRRIRINDCVFPSDRGDAGLSDMALNEVIRGMNGDSDPPIWLDPVTNRAVVPHGFRSSFKDWATEKTDFPGEVSEMALSHRVSDKVEAAYRRGDLFEKRRALAEAWAKYCCSRFRDRKDF